MIRKVRVTANACECDVCHYEWLSLAPQPPVFCPSRLCQSRRWNGPRQRSLEVIKLPAPRKPGRTRTVALIDINRKGGADGDG